MTINFNIHKKTFSVFPNRIEILCEGYVLPRNSIFQAYAQFRDEVLIFELFKEFSWNFIHHVKGVFWIIIKSPEKTVVYNDRLGLKKLFYHEDQNSISLSNQIENLGKSAHLKLDENALALKTLLNREIGSDTIFENIKCTTAASELIFENGKWLEKTYWSPNALLLKIDEKYNIAFFEQLIKDNLQNLNQYFEPTDYSITLTGGKDSRTGLCALLNLGIKPIGVTYGDAASKDAVFAKKVAKVAEIEHHIFAMPKEVKNIENTVNQIVAHKNPGVSVHRAHRYFAFQQLGEITSPKQLYLAGYMAGELLMGIYYDDTVFPNFLTDIWEQKSALTEEIIQTKLDEYFVKTESKNLTEIKQKLQRLKTLDLTKGIYEAHLHGIFELGVPHHGQDIFLSQTILDYPYPFFLDIDFLDALFQSNYCFKFTDNKTKNLVQRYKLYAFNLQLQHRLFPKLSIVPFAKKGNYTTKDYLRGSLLWSAVKVLNFAKDRKKYPPSFVYNQAYTNFVKKQLEIIQQDAKHDIHKIFDVAAASERLKNSAQLTQEKHWHKYTNIISTYLYFNAIQHEG